MPYTLVDGKTSVIAEAVDVVGNPAPGPSSEVTVTIVTVGSDYSGNLVDYNNAPIVYQAPASSLNQPITSATTTNLNSALSITSQNPNATVASLTVQLSLTHPNLADLSAVLIAPDGKTKVTLFGAGNLSGANLAGTTFSDAATTSLATGTAPYAGTFLTTDPKGLAQLAGQNINGTWTLQLTDNVAGNAGTLTNWSLAITPKPVTTASTFSSTTSSAIPGPPSTLTITGQGASTTVGNISVLLNLTYSSLGDLSAALIGPGGASVTLFNAGDLSGANLVNTEFSISATTSLSAGTAPYTGTFKPSDPQGLAKLIGQSMDGAWKLEVTDHATGNTGTLTGWSLTLTPQPVTTPQTFPLVPGSVIPAASSLSSPLTITGQGPLETVGSLSLQLNITDSNLANLSAVLIAPDGTTQVTLFNAGDLTGTNLVNTTFSDTATTSLSSGTSPYTGTFLTNDPAGLAKLIGQSINGTWTLLVTNAATGQTGTLNSWSLLITPAQAGASPVAVSVPPPVLIPAPSSTLSSPLTISGEGALSTVGNISVTLNLTDPSLAALSAVLIGPDGKTQVALFNAGDLSGANLTSTTFSDAASMSLSSGTAPYTGTFKPSDAQGLAKLIGQSVNGTWTLQITDTATGVSGTLNGWSLAVTPKAVTSSVSTASTIPAPRLASARR